MRLKTLLLILLCSFALVGCSKHEADKTSDENIVITLTEKQEENTQIETTTLSMVDMDSIITIPAQFKAQNQSMDRIYSPLDGKVNKIFVEPGVTVKTGQPLAEIKSDDISQIQLEFLERIMDIDAQIKQMQAQYEVSAQNYKRESILVNEKISSRAEFELAGSLMKKDKASLDSLRSQRSTLIRVYSQRMAVYGASGNSIQKVLATKTVYPYVTVASNKTGVVLERKINPGEFVEKNKELFSVANLSTIWLVGYAYEKDAPHLKTGDPVQGVMEEEKDEKVVGILSYVSPMLDTETKTLEVRADINNKDFKIKPNTYAEMFVKIATDKRLAIPNDAIEKYGDYSFAYVKIKPFTYEQRKIEIGQRNDKYSEVLSGVKEGDVVVTKGAFSLLGECIKKQEEN